MLNDKKILSSSQFYRNLDKLLPGEIPESLEKSAQNRIFFTHISSDGLKDFHEYSTKDKRFYKYLEYTPFTSVNDSKKYLKRLMDLEGIEPLGRTSKAWFINHKLKGKIVGTARLVKIDFHRQSVMWGYGIDPELWGQGYVLEVQHILKKYIFETLSLNRLYGSAMISNKPTISTLLAVGMKEEGIERESMRDANGIYHDAWRYSMLSEDYFTDKDQDKDKEVDLVLPTTKLFNKEELENIIGNVIQDATLVTDDFMMNASTSWDSLKQMELVLALETVYKIQLTFDEIIEMTSINAIENIIKKRLSISKPFQNPC